MNNYFDISLIREIILNKNDVFQSGLRQIFNETKFVNNQLNLSPWPAFLEYVGLQNIFDAFPKYDAQHKLYEITIAVLKTGATKDLIIRLYDQFFAECLTQVKSLPQIDAEFLLNRIQEKENCTGIERELFQHNLQLYKTGFKEVPYELLHDLILYLAWDRVCVFLAAIFEYPNKNLKFIQSIKILRNCMIESFMHITEQGKCSPSFFRMAEALYAMEMREENLNRYSENDWNLLCRGARALRSQMVPLDALYIDVALANVKVADEAKGSIQVFTLEKPAVVQDALELTKLMLNKLSAKDPNWTYALYPLNVVCMRSADHEVMIDTVIKN